MSTRRIALRIAYDGTDYAGWQRQKNGLSIQQVIEETIERLFGESVHLTASGRTDAGVHAEGQVAAFDLAHEVPVERLKAALNSNLPETIRVMEVWEATPDFQPRFDAKRKTYRYAVYNAEILPPQDRLFAVREYRRIDWKRVAEALHLIEGTHDFAAFHSTGSSEKGTVRTVFAARTWASAEKPDLHLIEVTGNGFLYNMVRIIVGTVLDIGCGKREMSCIEAAFQTGNRDLTGPTAPAKGLTLVQVEYEKTR